MLRFLLTSFIIIFLGVNVFASDTLIVGKGGNISSTSTYVLKVGKLKSAKSSFSYGVEYVNVNLKTKATSKLSISLLDPDGSTTVLLYNGGGKSGTLLDSTIFSDTAKAGVLDGSAPFSGSFRPLQSLRFANNGQTIAGNWTLQITDGKGGSTEILLSWSIKFGSNPSRGGMDSSTLPILIINTNKKTIPGLDAYLTCKVYALDNGYGNWNYIKDSLQHKSYAGFKLHGNSSRSAPKLSYAMQMEDATGAVHDTSIFGMPKEHDWVLVANYFDNSLLHNALSQYLYAKMGNYGPRYKHIEVILDGVYQGIYLCIEKVKVGPNRLPISKLESTALSGDSLTGGYIIKSDWNGNGGWTSKYASPEGSNQVYQYDYPWPIPKKQHDYIQAYWNTFEDSINSNKFGKSRKSSDYPGNWRKYGNEKGIIDYFLTLEMSCNFDTYDGGSYFMYKDKDSRGGKVTPGPPWDYDLAWGNYGGTFSSWEYTSNCVSTWYPKLMGQTNFGKGDSLFKNELKCYWTVYRRGFMSNKSIFNWLDSNATYLKDAQQRNFAEWAVPSPDFKHSVDTLKYFINMRFKWLDKNMPGTCRRDINPPTVSLNGKDTVYLEVNTPYKDPGITYHDNFGDTNVTVKIGSNLDTSLLGTYVYGYFLSDKAGNSSSVERVIKVVDTIAPTISFLYGDTVAIEVLEKYNTDADVIIEDNYDTSLIVSKWGTFNFVNNIPDTLGYYTLWYKATDHSGNVDSAMKVVQVADMIAPKIWFTGKDTVKVEVYDTYSDTDVHISDNYDKAPVLSHHGNLKNYKTDSIGFFAIWYKGEDASYNTDSVLRIIDVVDEIAPTINLLGRDSVTFSTTDSITYLDSGYSVSDNYDKHPRVDTTSDFINAQTAGIFHITYGATDQSKNKSLSVTRVITVTQGSGIENAGLSSSNIRIYPNPGSGKFLISIKMQSGSKAWLSIYDDLGKELTEYSGEVANGWNGSLDLSNEPSGMYTLKLQTNSSVTTRKLILLK